MWRLRLLSGKRERSWPRSPRFAAAAGGVVVVACLVTFAFPLPARSGTVTVARARWLMGTLCSARATAATAADTLRVGAALDAALDEIATLERALSNWDPKSELCVLNAAGGPRMVSEPLFAVIDSALAMAALTQGAFDPTVEVLTEAWDLRGKGRVPGERELADARARVGAGRVRITPLDRAVDLQGARLDLGGIGKGFALDRAAERLRERGVSGVLDAGGQRLAVDVADTVAVAAPGRREEIAAGVVLARGSLATSAQSEHFFVAGGRKYGHVLDPRTGRPVSTRAAVAVRAASATRADALSTAMLVLGPGAASAFARAHPDVGILWLQPGRGRRVRIQRWNMDP